MNKKNVIRYTVVVLSLFIVFVFYMFFTGIGDCRGFCSTPRDTKRVADLKMVQSYLEIYFDRWGHYPGTVDGKLTVAPITWDDLKESFISLGIKVPNDPMRSVSNSRTYYYTTNEDNSAYILGAIFENTPDSRKAVNDKLLKDPKEIDAIPTAFNIPSGMHCDDDMLGYCIGSASKNSTAPMPQNNLFMIDLDENPAVDSGYTIGEHQIGGKVKIEKRSDGNLYLNGHKVVLYLSNQQESRGMSGMKLREELTNQTVLNATVADYLLNNSQLIPESWKMNDNGRDFVSFHGTVFSHPRLGSAVRGLTSYGGQWAPAYLGLGCCWSMSNSSAVLEK